MQNPSGIARDGRTRAKACRIGSYSDGANNEHSKLIIIMK